MDNWMKFYTGGCKHGKVDQKNAPAYQNHTAFGQRLKVAAKYCLHWMLFFMMTSIVMLNT